MVLCYSSNVKPMLSYRILKNNFPADFESIASLFSQFPKARDLELCGWQGCKHLGHFLAASPRALVKSWTRSRVDMGCQHPKLQPDLLRYNPNPLYCLVVRNFLILFLW